MTFAAEVAGVGKPGVAPLRTGRPIIKADVYNVGEAVVADGLPNSHSTLDPR